MLRHNSWPHHRFCHTLVGASLVGIALAVVLFPFRSILAKLMNLLQLPYKTTFMKMAIWGVLGGWFHVFIDSICHWDVELFWPNKAKPFYNLVTYQQLKTLCLGFWLAAIILLLFAYIEGRIEKAVK
jgi:membrane-bound metal-dependent hydrolase YbcI (DUF457 family)